MPVTLVRDEEQSLGDLISRYYEAKTAAEEAEALARSLNEEIKSRMKEAGQKTKTVPWGPKKLRATYSSNNNIVIDEAGLKKALGARSFHKVTVEKVDRTKLNEAVESGALDGNIVRQYVRNEPRPQLRLSIVEESEDDEA